MNDTKNKLILFAVIGLLLIAVVLLTKCNKNPEVTPERNIAGDYHPDLPDININSGHSDDYQPLGSSDGISLMATSGFTFKANCSAQILGIKNIETNNCVITVSIYLSDGTVLYESGYINPDECIDQIEISQTLPAGLYKSSLLVYRCYSMDSGHTAISQCEFPIEINFQ